MDPKGLKVAVTGGIGSGKTEFTKYLQTKGFPVISADKEAKDILLSNPVVKEKIVKAFGENSYTKTGINARYLAENVFSDPEKVKKINSIVHPQVIKHIRKLMDSLLAKHAIVFVEAALIYEADMEDLFDYVILVTCDEKEKIKRLIERDKVSEDEIRQRMESQIPDETKKTWADFTFENNAGLPELQAKADFLVSILKTLSGTK